MASNRVCFEDVALVVEPRRYWFTDFIELGVPLSLLSCLVTLIFPFNLI